MTKQSSNNIQKGNVSSTQNLLLTVGLCVRNGQSTLNAAINSVANQDFPHEQMEMIFVDDGSTDKTAEILNEYAAKKDIPAKVFSHAWRGIGYGRNVVAKNAEGKYILWVDGDMVLSPGYIPRIVDFMEKNPQFAITKGVQELRYGGNLFATLELLSRASSRMVDYSSEKTSSKALGTGGAIYRTEAIKQAGYFDDTLTRYGEDQDIEIRIRKNGWKLASINVSFQDYERLGIKWKSLYKRYYVRGYCTHYFLHKNPGLIKLYKMLPPAVFLAGILQAQKIFRKTHYRQAYLLPFHNMLKMYAWYIGFVSSHGDSYQPK